MTANTKRDNHDFGNTVCSGSLCSWAAGGSELGSDSNGDTVFEVRIEYRGDVARELEPEVPPALPSVVRAIHAVAVGGRDAAHLRLARPGVDDVRVARRDGERADRADAEVTVGDVAPGLATVVRAPDPAAGRAQTRPERSKPTVKMDGQPDGRVTGSKRKRMKKPRSTRRQ